jgi:hypothetical protein
MPAAAADVAYDMQCQQQMEYQELFAQTPVLGFLRTPAVLLAGLQLSQDGSLVLLADQLQQLLADSAAAAALSDGCTAGSAGGSSNSSSSSSMLGPGGFAVVHVAAYVLDQPGQFASCVAAVQGAAPPEAAVEQAARRDMGILSDVDEDAISALVGALVAGPSLLLSACLTACIVCGLCFHMLHSQNCLEHCRVWLQPPCDLAVILHWHFRNNNTADTVMSRFWFL